ncbi:MAG: hypothetical protein LH465_03170 [Sphingomonas bacterium]|nr:hypothetical protein [Sphingomonas bacterium]
MTACSEQAEPENVTAAPTVPPVTIPVPRPAAQTPSLALEGEGLRLFNRDSGAARPVAFGTVRAETLAALAFRGPPEIGKQNECGAGALDYAAWPDGLKLYFQNGAFAGWAVNGHGKGGTNTPALTTAAGIGPGSTRAQLTDAYDARFVSSTIGTEFTAGGLAGLLDGPQTTARITDLWAGVSCIFR